MLVVERNQLAADEHVGLNADELASALAAETAPADLDSAGWGKASFESAMRSALLSKALAGKLFPSVDGGMLVRLKDERKTELSVARETVIAAFSIVFGALMLGLAIAFGLGGRQLARDFLERNLGDRKKEKTEEPQPL